MKKMLSVSLLMLASTSASAATSYYNCALKTGCKEVNINSTSTSTYTQTKYPVVLQHGMLGTSEHSMASFYGIQEDLAKNGSKVFVTETNAFNSSYVRGEALLNQVDRLLALSNAEKLNLVGHSHGGFDIRYVAAHRPNAVASITAVGSPARGSEVADLIQKVRSGLQPIDNGLLMNTIASVVNFVGRLHDSFNGKDDLHQDAIAGLDSLTTEGAAKFNKEYPTALETECDTQKDTIVAENGVAYYSWSGTGHFTNPFDPLDGGLTILDLAFSGKKNDGLVSRCSSHVGYVVRDDYPMNHLDEVNQVFGLHNWAGTNPKTAHRTQINRLKKAGY